MQRERTLADKATASKRLVFDGVSKRFGSSIALHKMSLDIQPGELVALLGPSGCGKTTTLRLIAGFEFPDSGVICVDGVDISSLPTNKRGLGMVFQNYSLFPHMTVAQNIGFGLQMAGVDKAEIARSVARMLELVQLPEFGGRDISQLSGGQQQRIALARAIVTNPSVLLLDEPLGALDKNLREGMQLEIRRVQQDLGITSVMVTHDQEEAMTMSDRIVVMDRGNVLQVGPPREVYNRPRTRFVAEFLGTANIITCRIASQEEHRVSLVPKDAPASSIQFNTFFESKGLRRVDDEVEVAIRPEKLALDAPESHHIIMQGQIREHIFRGAQHSYMIDIPALNRCLCAYRQAGLGKAELYQSGQVVTVSFDPDDVVILEPDENIGSTRPKQVSDSIEMLTAQAA